MRHARRFISISVIVVALAAAGIALAVTAGGSTTPTVAAGTTAMAGTTTIHTAFATVNGKTESVLANSKGLPLYFYKADTATKSFVSGGLAALWPPLTSTSPTIAGANGKLSVIHDANGAQVAYNGHFLYTFADDNAGHATGQGVEDFFVATPALTQISSSSSASTAPAAAKTSGGGYAY
jgi:predicted lipoprotein with Yx(FWY)xxD motif